MGSLITYSAIAAKLAAMRGHFLTDDEFSVLAGMENVPAAVEYLKSSPAYRDVFSGVENEEHETVSEGRGFRKTLRSEL